MEPGHSGFGNNTMSNPDREREQDFYIGELQKEFARMNGILFGAENSGGAITKIDQALTKIDTKIDAMQREQHYHRTEITTKIAIVEERLQDAEKDIDGLGNKVRKLDHSISDKSRAVVKRINDILWPLVGLGPITLIVMGIREFITQSGG